MKNNLLQHHQQHRTWLGQLDFYTEEMDIFRKELYHIMDTYSSSYSVIEHAEEYKRIFTKKQQLIDELKAKIVAHEKQLAKTQSTEADELWDHEEMGLSMKTFVDEMETFKQNFRRFTARHLH